MKKNESLSKDNALPKSPTGIKGLDEITNGGLPKGRPTLVCGGAGCGKTLLAIEFLVRGATVYNEPGVFISFEESAKDLSMNVASLGFDLDNLIKKKKLVLDHVLIERSEIEESGEFDLSGLFVRLDYAIDSIGAKRVALDTIESLFSGLPNPLIIRAELRRLFRWLKDKGVTAIITGERGDDTLTKQGLEEYVSDCVILLDHRVSEQSSTRRLRIMKYRGSRHGTNEFPFLIDEEGISVLPITSIGLDHGVSMDHISSGIHALDTMLSKKGFYKGSSILISGTAGTGKTSFSAKFAESACNRGEKVLYFSLEESPAQVMRNMRSIGIDLDLWRKKQLLGFHSIRPTVFGLEMHLTTMIREITRFKPEVVVVDPLNSFLFGNMEKEAKALCIRLIDFLKMNSITAYFTSLTVDKENIEHSNIFISSLIDTWILLKNIESGNEITRGIYILKSRGMAHSSDIRVFRLTDNGIVLNDPKLTRESQVKGFVSKR